MDRMAAPDLDPTAEARLRAALGRLIESTVKLDPAAATRLQPALDRLVKTVSGIPLNGITG